MRGSWKRLASLPPILLAILISTHARVKPEPHYTFILPAGYVGWVQVIFNDPSASPLPVRRDGGRVIEVPESGMPRTSDIRVHDSNRKDEFYYQSSQTNGTTELRPVPTAYVLPGDSHGGFGVMDTGGKGLGYSWFFFVGPPELRGKVPLADYDKVRAAHTTPDGHQPPIPAPNPYPSPGRMSPTS